MSSHRANEVLAAEYEGSKAEVLRTVTAKLGGSPPSGVDLEAAYNEAWHALYLRLEEGEEVDNRKGFLVTVAYRRALSEHRAVRLEHAANGDLAEIAVEPDIEAHLDAEIQLRHLRQGLRAELDERELQAATLCLLHGYSRPEAARLIGIAPRRMEKLMDRATRRINAVIGVVRPGELCESFDSMVRAFAVGMLDEDGERYRLARDHLADCPACRRKVLVLRGLGSVTPPLPALFGILAGSAGAAGVGAKAGLGAKAGAAKGRRPLASRRAGRRLDRGRGGRRRGRRGGGDRGRGRGQVDPVHEPGAAAGDGPGRRAVPGNDATRFEARAQRRPPSSKKQAQAQEARPQGEGGKGCHRPRNPRRSKRKRRWKPKSRWNRHPSPRRNRLPNRRRPRREANRSSRTGTPRKSSNSASRKV